MFEWTTLTEVLGHSVLEPTEADMRRALGALFDGTADAEHPDTWIECGSESGPLYCISVYASGYAIFTKYSDADMTAELDKKTIQPVDTEAALALWRNLVAGRLP